MDSIMKIAYLMLCVFAIMTFWPLIVVLLAGLAVFILYSSWKTKKLLKEAEPVYQKSSSNSEVFEAEYTERDVSHE